MTRRYRLPARHSSATIEKVDLDEIVEWTASGAWAETALADEAARMRRIALSVADAAVYTVGRVFERHSLVGDVFELNDNDALYRVITEVATRLIHKRLIERFSDGRRDPAVEKEIAVSILLKEYSR